MIEAGYRERHAQTILQLFRQLEANGRSTADLRFIRDIYGLAMRLYSGSYSGSGKTTISHLIGAASILDHLRAPIAVVGAGLLHSAYISGDFGDASKAITKKKRTEVRTTTGIEAEEYIFRFARLEWSAESIPRILDRVDDMGPTDRTTLLVRLADQLDKWRDLGSLYLYRNMTWEKAFARESGPLVVQMSTKLGHEPLTRDLEYALLETSAATLPEGLHDLKWTDRSHIIPSRSHQRRLRIVVVQEIGRARRVGRQLIKRARRMARRLFG